MKNPTHLLYVDDDDDIRAIIELAFDGDPRFKLTLCQSGQEALVTAQQDAPDAILLDVMMPGMDGPTTFQKLRKLPNLGDIPVLFLTAKIQPPELKALFDLGATDVITKPFDALSLPDHIFSQLASSQ